MSIAEQGRPDGRTKDFTSALSRVKETASRVTNTAVAKVTDKVPLKPMDRLQRMARSPRVTVPTLSKEMKLATDRVRARPAISPTLSMNIGMTAIGLGIWGVMFPNSVRRALGVTAPAPLVQALFGLRELATGYALAGDPTKSEVLWARVAGDAFDIAVLKALDNPKNRSRGGAKAALAFVLGVTALDVITAVRMTNVKRNCA